MKDIVLLIFGLSYVTFGLLIFIRPKLGSKLIERIPMWHGGIFNSTLVPMEQKKVRPFIVRLLGMVCILIGLLCVSVSK